MSIALIPVEDGRRIDRSQPAILQGRMNSDDWSTFCDQHDAVAVPSSPRCPSRMNFLTTLIFLFGGCHNHHCWCRLFFHRHLRLRLQISLRCTRNNPGSSLECSDFGGNNPCFLLLLRQHTKETV